MFFSAPSEIGPQKHLDSKLSCYIHIKIILTKMNIALALLQKCELELPRPPVIIIYKAFIIFSLIKRLVIPCITD